MPRHRNLPLLLIFAIICSNSIYADSSKKDTGKCKFMKYDEKNELKSLEIIRPLIGKKFTSQDDVHNTKFTIGICADLEQGDAGAIQVTKDDTGKETIRNIGSLSDTHLMAGTDWAYLQYLGGEIYHDYCGGQQKQTAILLGCDENIGDEDARMVYMEEEKLKTSSCYYLFELKHKALCPVPSSSSTLGIGSILIIVFISVLGVYLLVGFAYQRFVLGSKGLEQLPNHEFWKDFGNLQADGCDLICRTKERRNTGFRGIGDEQLDPAEETRDDNLLPM